MATPQLKDLPKVAVDLKSQLESFSPDSLKNASTEEKFLLPTAEGKFHFHFNFNSNSKTASRARNFIKKSSIKLMVCPAIIESSIPDWFTDPYSH